MKPVNTTDDAAADPEEATGDTGAPDIVGPTGEEMPTQTHAEVHGGPIPPPEPRPTSG